MLVPKILCALTFSLATAGILTVETEPGAEVVWEGVVLGRADALGRMEIQDIPLGSYALTVSKDGFSPLRKTVEVQAGRQSASFRLFALSADQPSRSRLKPSPAPASADPSVVQAALAPTSTAEPSNSPEPDAESNVQRSSQIDRDRSSETPLIWFFLVAVVMAGVLVRFLRRPQQAFPPPGPQRAVPSQPDMGGGPSQAAPGSSAAFLDDLRRREAMAEKGVMALAKDEEESAIELDKTAVRHVDES